MFVAHGVTRFAVNDGTALENIKNDCVRKTECVRNNMGPHWYGHKYNSSAQTPFLWSNTLQLEGNSGTQAKNEGKTPC